MKSSKRILAALAAAFSVSATAQADCALPLAPSKIPNGATASEQEMMSAMQTLKQYDGDVNTYLKCLQFEVKQSRVSKDDQDRMHNSAVEQLSKIAEKFNEQVRVFKSKNG